MSIIQTRNSKAYTFTKNENVYYNIDIFNPDGITQPAVFDSTRTSNILDNPNEYELAIIRFSVPTKSIPIMILDPITKNYKVSVEYNGFVETQDVSWIPNNNCPTTQYWISTYQEFIDSINLALLNCYTNIVLADPTYPSVQAPYFRLDGNLVNFVAEQSINSATSGVKWFMNTELQTIIPTISYNLNCVGAGNLSFQIVVKDNKNNKEVIDDIPVFVMVSESSPLFLWNDFQNLLFQSNTIPVVPELLGTSVQNTRRVLTDFNPQASFFDRTPLQFFPQGPLRWYDLKSSQPLNQVDLIVSWADKAGKLYPIELLRYDTLSVKILFRRKGNKSSYDDLNY
jgi:hypothetical protein